jgi:hypothetical protein
MEEEIKQQDNSQKKQSGRPLKPVKKTNNLVVRMTEKERLLIAGKAREAGMKLSEWFRLAAKRARVVARLSPGDVTSDADRPGQ